MSNLGDWIDLRTARLQKRKRNERPEFIEDIEDTEEREYIEDIEDIEVTAPKRRKENSDQSEYDNDEVINEVESETTSKKENLWDLEIDPEILDNSSFLAGVQEFETPTKRALPPPPTPSTSTDSPSKPPPVISLRNRFPPGGEHLRDSTLQMRKVIETEDELSGSFSEDHVTSASRLPQQQDDIEDDEHSMSMEEIVPEEEHDDDDLSWSADNSPPPLPLSPPHTTSISAHKFIPPFKIKGNTQAFSNTSGGSYLVKQATLTRNQYLHSVERWKNVNNMSALEGRATITLQIIEIREHLYFGRYLWSSCWILAKSKDAESQDSQNESSSPQRCIAIFRRNPTSAPKLGETICVVEPIYRVSTADGCLVVLCSCYFALSPTDLLPECGLNTELDFYQQPTMKQEKNPFRLFNIGHSAKLINPL